MTEENKVQNESTDITNEDRDQIKDVIEEHFQRMQLQSMLIGGQTVCKSILSRIIRFEQAPGRKTLNGHRRLIKDIKEFCETSISQDDSTKLMEDEDANI